MIYHISYIVYYISHFIYTYVYIYITYHISHIIYNISYITYHMSYYIYTLILIDSQTGKKHTLVLFPASILITWRIQRDHTPAAPRMVAGASIKNNDLNAAPGYHGLDGHRMTSDSSKKYAEF